MIIFRILWTSNAIINGEVLFDKYDYAFHRYTKLCQHPATVRVALFEVTANEITGIFDASRCIMEYDRNGNYQYTQESDFLPRLDEIQSLVENNIRSTFSRWRQHWNLKISYKCYTNVQQHWREIVKLIRAELSSQISEIEEHSLDDLDFRTNEEKAKDTKGMTE